MGRVLSGLIAKFHFVYKNLLHYELNIVKSYNALANYYALIVPKRQAYRYFRPWTDRMTSKNCNDTEPFPLHYWRSPVITDYVCRCATRLEERGTPRVESFKNIAWTVSDSEQQRRQLSAANPAMLAQCRFCFSATQATAWLPVVIHTAGTVRVNGDRARGLRPPLLWKRLSHIIPSPMVAPCYYVCDLNNKCPK